MQASMDVAQIYDVREANGQESIRNLLPHMVKLVGLGKKSVGMGKPFA
jgi:hypothetical protein